MTEYLLGSERKILINLGKRGWNKVSHFHLYVIDNYSVYGKYNIINYYTSPFY